MPQLTRKGYIRLFDKAVSDFVRKRDRLKYEVCPFCKNREIVNAFHFVSRRHYILRWDVELNIVGSCWECNAAYSGKWGGGNQASYWRWYLKEYGQEQWDRLISKSRQVANFSTNQIKEMYENFNSSHSCSDNKVGLV